MTAVFWRWIALLVVLIPSLSHGQPTVRVLTVVSNEAMQFLGVTSATILATNEIAKTNKALADSKANLRVELAGVVQRSMPMPITVDNSIKLAKNDLNILGSRDAQNADVVVVIHRTVVADGVALAQPATRPQDAFAAIHPQQTLGALYGYPHELGHLFGASHQDTGGAVSPSGRTGNWPSGQGFYFRHNVYLSPPPTNLSPYCKHTLMAYPPVNVLKGVDCTNSPSTHLLLFSTPNVCEMWYSVNPPYAQIPLCYGDSSHNNAQIVSQIGPSLVNFRNTKLRPRTVSELLQAILNAVGLTDPAPSCPPGC